MLGVESDLLSIGALAQASGLSISALRFYAGVGVLPPAFVDPQTGYRWYARDQVRPARLVAGLRRVGMPLAGISAVLARQGDRVAVGALLDAHLRRLEDGLDDARRELSRLNALILAEEKMTTSVVVSTMELSAALDAVRFAVGVDPELPVLGGVLFEIEQSAVCLVATDRYRLAVARARTRSDASATGSALVPDEFVGRLRVLLDLGGEARLSIDGGEISATVRERRITQALMGDDFPDYRDLIRARGGRRVVVDVAALRQELLDAVTWPRAWPEGDTYQVSVLVLDGEGRLGVAAEPATAADGQVTVGVNRAFLLEALAAPRQDQLVLELDGPITPLAIRTLDDDRSFSILMPVRL